MPIAFPFSTATSSAFCHTPLLHIVGPDAAAFVHRLSTQDLLSTSQQAKLCCFLDKKGRIHEMGQALSSATEVYFLGWPGTSRDPSAFLDAFHFAEDLTQTLVAAEVFLVVGLPSSPAEYASETRGAVQVWGAPKVWTHDAATSAAWVFSVEPGAARAFLAEHKVALSTEDAWQEIRVASGWPAFGAEANEKSNPLELALHDALSWTKGCYVGQEVISRIDNYDKQQKHLVGLVLDEASEIPSEGFHAEVFSDGVRVGSTTSWSGNQGMALLKISHTLIEGTQVELRSEGKCISATTQKRFLSQEPHDR